MGFFRYIVCFLMFGSVPLIQSVCCSLSGSLIYLYQSLFDISSKVGGTNCPNAPKGKQDSSLMPFAGSFHSVSHSVQ